MGLVAGAIIGGAVIGGTASVIGSSKAASASKQAAAVQSEAANRAADLQHAQFEETKGNLQPFVDFGRGQIPNLNSLLPGGDSPTQRAVMNLLGLGTDGSLNPAARQAALESTPGYQFTRDQGLKAVQNGFAAQGLGRSGAALKGAASFATGLADQTYEQQLQNYVSTWQNQFQNTYNATSLGGNAAAGLGSIGQQSITAQNALTTSGAAATAGGIVGAANASVAGLTGAAGAIGNSLLPATLAFQGFTPNGWTAPNSGIFSNSALYNPGQGGPVNPLAVAG